jgi:hypothetical protein
MPVLELPARWTAEADRPRLPRRTKWGGVGGAAVLLVAFVTGLAWWHATDTAKADSATLKANEKVWLAAATGALQTPLAGSNLCGSSAAGDSASAQASLPGYGPISRICVMPNTNLGAPQVQFLRDEQHGFGGLVYNPDNIALGMPDECVGHLDGPWWQFQPLLSSNGCPTGFQFVGGG